MQFTWKPFHTEVLLLVSKGESTKDIAIKVRKGERYIQKIKLRPEFQEKLAKLNVQVDARLVAEGVKNIADEVFLKDAARKELERASLVAAKAITNLLSRRKKLDRNEITEMRLKFEAAKDVLDRIGLKPREVVETIERSYLPEEITSAMNTMKELSTMGTNQFVFGGQIRKANRPVEKIESTNIPPITEGQIAEGTQSTIEDR